MIDALVNKHKEEAAPKQADSKYYFQVEVREGQAGCCDDSSYTSYPYKSFAECYHACCRFSPRQHWQYHRATKSTSMRRNDGPAVGVRSTATECGIIDIDDLTLLGITEDEFDRAIELNSI
jgi:hypothetical protein